ncbi:hypothetical protein ACSBR1_005475 [Camellia fascicularis]
MFNVIRFYILRFQATSKPGMCFAERCRTRVMQLPRDVLICDYLKGFNFEPLPQLIHIFSSCSLDCDAFGVGRVTIPGIWCPLCVWYFV